MAKTVKKQTYYEALGRRKEAVARVRLYILGKEKDVNVDNALYQKGAIMVNGKKAEDYFLNDANKKRFLSPFILTQSLDRFVLTAQIRGGGTTGQLEAFLLGLSRALQMIEQEFRPILKQANLLTRDARIRERRKVGTGGKARRAKQSPKR